MADGLLADIGIGIVLPIRPSPFATSFLVLGFNPWHFDVSSEFLDKVSVMNPT